MTDHKANAKALDIALFGKQNVYTPPEEFMPRRTTIAEKLAELYPDRDAVDHKAETERLIKFAEESGSVSAATAAVATATLALAEQQRTANLIAYSNVLEENQRDGFELTDDGRTFMDHLEAEIREGLGL